ncbi:MAG: helix-turn-helix domain-containing protein [Candidatus Accumulibacter sp.]|nr:helix-turn-helix domain-containing protein [Accumulibacter sp.]
MTKITQKKAERSDWHPADIKAALDKAGWTLRSLAAHHGLTSSTSMSHTFLRSYPLNERRIANAIGVNPQDIWPSRYNEDGTKRPRGLRGLRANSSASHCHGNDNFRD